MKILFLTVGKTDSRDLNSLISEYVDRIGHFVSFEMICLQDLKSTKSLSTDLQKEKEGKLIANQIQKGDYVVLLDENGKEYSSRDFSSFLDRLFAMGRRRLVFIIGGPYGFSDEIYKLSDAKVSLSKMTFSHQMVRLLFVEQFYRGLTILNHIPYHHD